MEVAVGRGSESCGWFWSSRPSGKPWRPEPAWTRRSSTVPDTVRLPMFCAGHAGGTNQRLVRPRRNRSECQKTAIQCRQQAVLGSRSPSSSSSVEESLFLFDALFDARQLQRLDADHFVLRSHSSQAITSPSSTSSTSTSKSVSHSGSWAWQPPHFPSHSYCRMSPSSFGTSIASFSENPPSGQEPGYLKPRFPSGNVLHIR